MPLTSHRTKFQPKAKPYAFLGYPNGMKAYRLYDIHVKQVFVSRNIIFHEEVFPFHSVANAEHLHDPFPESVLPLPLLDPSISPITQSMTHQSSPSHDQSNSSS